MAAWTIELTPKRAKNPIWPPTQHTLRGRIDIAQLPFSVQQEFGEKLSHAASRLRERCNGIVPGIRISLDWETGEAVIFDPLEEDTPNNEEIFKALALTRTLPKNLKPFRRIETTLTRKDQIATWLHWMNEFVERGIATPIEGKRPAKKPTDIGRVKHNPFSTDPLEAKYLDEKDKTPMELMEERAGKARANAG